MRLASVRLRTPSLTKMLLRCRFAVRSLMNSRSANSRFVRPNASSGEHLAFASGQISSPFGQRVTHATFRGRVLTRRPGRLDLDVSRQPLVDAS